MIFDFSNIIANFQGYINSILAKKFMVFIIVYLNKTFTYTNNVNLVNYIW